VLDGIVTNWFTYAVVRPMATSVPVFAPQSIDEIEAEFITPELPICPRYLDGTLDIFRRHKHPFNLVSTLTMTWSGVNSLAQEEIDILIRSLQGQVIMEDLINMGEWELCKIPASEEPYAEVSLINTTSVPDIWLRSRVPDPWFHYLRFWPEALYKLSIDCAKIEVPDVLNNS